MAVPEVCDVRAPCVHWSPHPLITISEMSATFIKGKVPEGVNVTVQSITTVRGKNQLKATIVPREGQSTVIGQSYVHGGL